MKKIIYLLTTILFTFFSDHSLIASEKKDQYSCKPKHAAAIRSNGIQTFKIKGDEKPVLLSIYEGFLETNGMKIIFCALFIQSSASEILYISV